METKELATLPEEDEAPQAIVMRKENLANLALLDPQAIEERLVALEKTLAVLRAVAIKSTHPYDWTLFKDKDGKVVGVPRDSGTVQIRKWMGITIFNYRPLENGSPNPEFSQIKKSDGTVATVARMWADGLCSRTGETVEGIEFSAELGTSFTGSGSVADLRASVRTGLDTKITRILSGLRKVPEDILKAMGVDTERCHKGHGFGTSSERQAGKVAEEGVAEKAAALREDILRRVGGDTATARQLCKEITSATKKDGTVFAGFDTTDRLTQGWQLEAAIKKLKAHPIFGDAARQPGEDG